MRTDRRSPLAILAALAMAGALLLALAAVAPALAKGDMEAALDAPIARDTPGGTELRVDLTAVVRAGDEVYPVTGTAIALVLTGPDGDITRATGERQQTDGHYTMLAIVPAGGVASLEVVIPGSSCEGNAGCVSSDWAITVVGSSLVAGPIGPGTAQAVAAGPTAPAATTAAEPNAVAVRLAIGAAIIAMVVAGMAIAAVGLARRSRRRRSLASPPGTPGT